MLSALALGGCNTILQRPAYVQRTTWPLSLPPPSTIAAGALARPRRVLLVQDFTAAPGLDQRGVLWLNADGSIHVDFYNVWEVQPARAVGDNVRRWLTASHLFAAVVGPASGLTADLVLEGELTTFVADPRVLRGRAAMSLILLDQRSVPAKSLLQRTLSAEAPMPQDTPGGVVAAQRDALAALLGNVVQAMRPFA
ncbi:MAG TPA: ABC-type transport auxiliary lipoprotein family protein [Acetobacteraceae bacterium]|nr:ABC-type transport auxiliary lipoprotein family protein [Acetobacteraceae bacterium]